RQRGVLALPGAGRLGARGARGDGCRRRAGPRRREDPRWQDDRLGPHQDRTPVARARADNPDRRSFPMIRRTIHALALALATLAFAAQAQYPNRAVKIIVPYPAGQATDIATRIVGEALAREWNQGVVIENIGGGAAIPGVVTAK